MKWAEILDGEGNPIGAEVSEDGRVRLVKRVKEKQVIDGYVRISRGGKILNRSVRAMMRRYHGQAD